MAVKHHKAKVLAVCLLTAAFFWLMNALNKENYNETVDYPISFEYDSTYMPVLPLPSHVRAEISGDGWSLLKKSWYALAGKPLIHKVYQPELARALDQAQLRNEIAGRIPGVRVISVDSDTFELAFEKRQSKFISMKVDSASINLDSGYVLNGPISIAPKTIEAIGPASEITKLPASQVIKISDKKIKGKFNKELEVNFPNLKLATLSQNNVRIRFEASIALADTASVP